MAAAIAFDGILFRRFEVDDLEDVKEQIAFLSGTDRPRDVVTSVDTIYPRMEIQYKVFGAIKEERLVLMFNDSLEPEEFAELYTWLTGKEYID